MSRAALPLYFELRHKLVPQENLGHLLLELSFLGSCGQWLHIFGVERMMLGVWGNHWSIVASCSFVAAGLNSL